MTLINTIKTKLKDGPMSFADFMQQALYDPFAGYYSAGLQKLGKDGDFITAPELTPLFAAAIANQVQQILSSLTNPSILEFGAGSGRLCVDLLRALEKLNSLPQNYYILEVSSSLKERQKSLIKTELPHLYERVQWLSSWPKERFNGVMLANEVLDAMPVHRFLHTSTGLLESFIKLNEQDELEEIFLPTENKRLIKAVTDLQTLPSPYISEVNLFIDDWLKEASDVLNEGAFFLIDYGFPRHEYYHPDRHTGTLMCHFRHQAHPNALIHVGKQDITAHVDFSHVADAADRAGFSIAGYCSQASFLLSLGLLNLVQEIGSESERLIVNTDIKKLLQPSEMGELFKVIALTKKIDFPLLGFQLHDKRASL
ncbi:MAG: SAM-dependent methyltransferase [Proteobacteria bacterium]|nr:SAM-dependent methyltransferase [Pseudomonadota bacterium]